MKIYDSVSELIGNTPLFRPKNYETSNGLTAALLLKLEYLNPAGSVKDRVALSVVTDAEKRGVLKKGGTIIEPTSGNTGIGLAAVAAAMGYKLIVTMPDSMSAERINLIKAYGAQVVLTDGKLGMSGAIQKADALAAELGGIVAGQFVNSANPQAHYSATAPEIWRDTDGNIDIFVAGVGTGGTISGVGKFLKEKKPDVRIVAVEPSSSPVLSEGKAGAHGIQGIGAGFIPQTLDTSVYDEVITVADDDAVTAAKTLGKTDGVLLGISSGAALHAATTLATRTENKGKTIVALMPDSADRYYSTSLFGN